MKYLIFHVERTGGTTFRHMLFDHYGWENGMVYPHYYEWEGKPGLNPFVETPEITNATFIIGHAVYYGIHEVIKDPCQYIAFFREPMARMQSLFNHIRIIDAMAGRPPSEFKEWFDHYQVASQVWSLCKPEAPSMAKAKQILDSTSFIGLQETFAADMQQLFGVYAPIEKNATKTLTEKMRIPMVTFTQEQRIAVDSVLAEDYELMDYTKRLREGGHNRGFKFHL